MTRLCQTCNAPLVRRSQERIHCFAARQFCNGDCQDLDMLGGGFETEYADDEHRPHRADWWIEQLRIVREDSGLSPAAQKKRRKRKRVELVVTRAMKGK